MPGEANTAKATPTTTTSTLVLLTPRTIQHLAEQFFGERLDMFTHDVPRITSFLALHNYAREIDTHREDIPVIPSIAKLCDAVVGFAASEPKDERFTPASLTDISVVAADTLTICEDLAKFGRDLAGATLIALVQKIEDGYKQLREFCRV